MSPEHSPLGEPDPPADWVGYRYDGWLHEWLPDGSCAVEACPAVRSGA